MDNAVEKRIRFRHSGHTSSSNEEIMRSHFTFSLLGKDRCLHFLSLFFGIMLAYYSILDEFIFSSTHPF